MPRNAKPSKLKRMARGVFARAGREKGAAKQRDIQVGKKMMREAGRREKR